MMRTYLPNIETSAVLQTIPFIFLHGFCAKKVPIAFAIMMIVSGLHIFCGCCLLL